MRTSEFSVDLSGYWVRLFFVITKFSVCFKLLSVFRIFCNCWDSKQERNLNIVYWSLQNISTSIVVCSALPSETWDITTSKDKMGLISNLRIATFPFKHISTKYFSCPLTCWIVNTRALVVGLEAASQHL